MGLMATFRTIKTAFDRRSPNRKEVVGMPAESSVEETLVFGDQLQFTGSLVVSGYPLLDPSDVRRGVNTGDGTPGTLDVVIVSRPSTRRNPLYDKRVDLQVRTRSEAPVDGTTADTWTTTARRIPAAIDLMTEKFEVRVGGRVHVATHMLFFAPRTIDKANNRIVRNGSTYTILGSENFRGDHMEIMLVENV